MRACVIAALVVGFLAGCTGMFGGSKGLCFDSLITAIQPGTTGPAVPLKGTTCLQLQGAK